jgi:hypothetical protein
MWITQHYLHPGGWHVNVLLLVQGNIAVYNPQEVMQEWICTCPVFIIRQRKKDRIQNTLKVDLGMKKLVKGYYLSRDIALQSIKNSSKKNSCAWFIVGQAKTHQSPEWNW